MKNIPTYKFKQKLTNDFISNKEMQKGVRVKKLKAIEEKRARDEAKLRVVEERARHMNEMERRENCAKLIAHTGLNPKNTYKAYFSDWWSGGEKNLYDIVIIDYVGLIKNETTQADIEYVRIKSPRMWGEMNININDIVRPRILSEQELEMIKEIDPYGEDEWGY
jgi:hypothetical protein